MTQTRLSSHMHSISAAHRPALTQGMQASTAVRNWLMWWALGVIDMFCIENCAQHADGAACTGPIRLKDKPACQHTPVRRKSHTYTRGIGSEGPWRALPAGVPPESNRCIKSTTPLTVHAYTQLQFHRSSPPRTLLHYSYCAAYESRCWQVPPTIVPSLRSCLPYAKVDQQPPHKRPVAPDADQQLSCRMSVGREQSCATCWLIGGWNNSSTKLRFRCTFSTTSAAAKSSTF